MIGFTANHGTQSDQSVKLVAFGQHLQRQGDFQGAGNRHYADAIFLNAESLEFFKTSIKFFFAGVLVETRNDNTNNDFGAVELALKGLHGHI